MAARLLGHIPAICGPCYRDLPPSESRSEPGAATSVLSPMTDWAQHIKDFDKRGKGFDKRGAEENPRLPDPKLSPYDYRTLAAFRFSLRGFLSFSEAAARAVGLTPRQHQALLGIKAASDGETTSMSQLADFLILRHNSTVGLIDRLEAARLVTRMTDPDDRRRVLVRLTAAGKRCLADLSAVHFAELERIRSELQSLLDRMTPHG